MGVLNGRADNKEQYVKVWEGHIADLDKLAMAAGCTQNDAYWAIKEQLRNMLEQAVENVYGSKS